MKPDWKTYVDPIIPGTDMGKRPTVFCEMFAGCAALTHHLEAGLPSLVSRMGNKQALRKPIFDVMGLGFGLGADRYLCCEPEDQIRRVLTDYGNKEVLEEALKKFQSIAHWTDPDQKRELWDECFSRKKEGRADMFDLMYYSTNCYSFCEIYFDQVGRSSSGKQTHATAGIYRLNKWLKHEWRVPVEARTSCFFPEPGMDYRGWIVYMDPPYAGTKGYTNLFPRENLVALANAWGETEASVYISENEGLTQYLSGSWKDINITDRWESRGFRNHKHNAEKPNPRRQEWLTTNVE